MARKILLLTAVIVIALAGKTFSDAAEKEHGHKTPYGVSFRKLKEFMRNF